MQKDVVYFVVYDDSAFKNLLPYVKIGKAKDLRKRLSGLQVSSPIKMGVAGFIRTPNASALEKALHNRYEKDSIIGEWFLLSLSMVKSLRSNYLIEADRFDEFLDPNAPRVEIRPRTYYEPNFREFEQLPKPRETRYKKLEKRQHKWNYDSLKSVKLPR